MRKTLALAALLLSAPAFAATTWSVPYPGFQSLAVCTTGTEAAPAGLVGLALHQVSGFAIHVEADAAMTACTIKAYLYNPQTTKWNEARELDVTVPAGVTDYAFAGFQVTAPVSRIAYVPVGCGQPLRVYIIGAGK